MEPLTVKAVLDELAGRDTARAAARLLGISEPYMSQLRHEVERPSVELAAKIASASGYELRVERDPEERGVRFTFVHAMPVAAPEVV
jgi:DNA-binding transcriptional regulator YdaS (Cro superfamily)